MFIDGWYQFANYTNPSQTVSLPIGYDDMLVYNLCVRCAPDFGAIVLPEIRELAGKTLYKIKFVNSLDIPIVSSWYGRPTFDIQRGF